MVRGRHGAGFSLTSNWSRSLGEQLGLVGDPAVLSAALAAGILVQDAVARHGERQPTARARIRHSANRFRSADGRGDLRVRRTAAERNLANFVPDTLLQFGAAKVEPEREPTGRRRDVLDDACHRRSATILVPHQLCLRKARLEIACKLRHGLPNHDRDDALVAQRDEDTAERALAGSVANFLRRPAAERSVSEQRLTPRGHASTEGRKSSSGTPKLFNAQLTRLYCPTVKTRSISCCTENFAASV